MKLLLSILLFCIFNGHAFAYVHTERSDQKRSVINSDGVSTNCSIHVETEFIALEKKVIERAKKRCMDTHRISKFRYTSTCQSLPYMPEIQFRLYSVQADFDCSDENQSN